MAKSHDDEKIWRFYLAALKLVKDAGQVINVAIDQRDKVIAEKGKPTDLVTETDKAVEGLLIEGLRYYVQFKLCSSSNVMLHAEVNFLIMNLSVKKPSLPKMDLFRTSVRNRRGLLIPLMEQ